MMTPQFSSLSNNISNLTTAPQLSGKRGRRILASVAGVVALTLGTAACANTTDATGTTEPAPIQASTEWVNLGQGVSCREVSTSTDQQVLLCDSSESIASVPIPNTENSEPDDILIEEGDTVTRTKWKKFGKGIKCSEVNWHGDEFLICDGNSGVTAEYIDQ